jgi:diadenosine tetraphosphate (Ap4A) HIT family hydrolase
MPVEALGDYDDSNIFARILRGELASTRIYEDDWAIAFHDINAHAPVHILVIPRGRWRSWADFSAGAADVEMAGFIRAVGATATLLGLNEPGYRLLVNVGVDAHQEVPHLHVHLFGGRQLGPMLSR